MIKAPLKTGTEEHLLNTLKGIFGKFTIISKLILKDNVFSLIFGIR